MDIIDKLQKQAIKIRGLSAADALNLFIEGSERPYRVLAAASEIREHFKGREIILCGIVNAKSGKCSENCKFCAQSSHYPTDAAIYPLMTAGRITEEARDAARGGAEFFGIVTSGKRIKAKKEWSEIFKAIEGVKDAGLKACGSLGIIDAAKAHELKAAGLYRYHHNLETSRSFFKNICTTHEYDEDIASVRAAQEAGLTVCSGGLIGLGEGITHRIEMAETLRELNVDSVPLNILNPIKGTPLALAQPLPPLEILMTIAVFRFMLPDKDIKLCGGKEKNLRQLLPLGVVAGANSLMTGNYLTTTGRDSSLDQEMIADLGLIPTREARPLCSCEMKAKGKAGKLKKGKCSA
ncbi:MAG: biotin synthase BioB [Syntrophales bacterium]|nr:biotin synthase BioB [Syntrophales bacterium]